MSKKIIIAVAAFLIFADTAKGSLGVWKITERVGQRYDQVSEEYLPDTTYYDDLVDDLQLQDVSVSVTPRGSYLDITEEAFVNTPSFKAAKDIDYWISGMIEFPKKATITSFFFVNDSGSYTGRIQPDYPQDFPVDTTLGEVVATIKWASDSRKNQNSDYYHLRVNDIAPGNEYRIILRYLIPNTGNAVSAYPLRVLCHSRSSNPGAIEFSFDSDSLQSAYTLAINDMRFQLSNGQSLQIPYQETFQLHGTDTTATAMHTTAIDTGSWEGKYLLLNTSIPDSVMAHLSKPLELVVLWRWNRPKSFVKKNENYRWLSGYGHQAVSQASAIKSLVNEVSLTGNKTGLVHSIQYKEPERFNLCGRRSSAFAKLDGYLSQFTNDYFINSGYFESDIEPANPEDTIIGPTDSSRTEFLTSLKMAHGLYSNGDGIMKHLVILSSGPVQISRNLITLEEIDTLLGEITVDCSDAVWRDVNFTMVKAVSAQESLTPFAGFKLPEFRPHSFLLELSTASKSFSFPISSNQKSFSLIAKAESEWSSQLVWSGYNSIGNVIGSVNVKNDAYVSPADTGLVKLWAANSERFSENRETGIGQRYGIVSETSSMKIFPSYRGYDSTATAFAPITNVYADEYHVGLKNRAKVSNDLKLSCKRVGNTIRIVIPGNARVNKIRIYSLAGKLLAQLDPAKYKTDHSYSIPLAEFFDTLNSQVVIIRMFGESGIWNKKMIL